MQHDDLVWLSKSAGLFYLVTLSVLVLAYVYWPSNKKRYDEAALAILHDDDDRPRP